MNNGKLKIKHVITSCGCDYLIPLTLVLLFDVIQSWSNRSQNSAN